MFAYHIMGAEVISEFALQGLRPASRSGLHPVVEVRTLREPLTRSGVLIREVPGSVPDEPFIEVFEGDTGIEYCASGIGRFWIEDDGGHIWCLPAAEACSRDLEHMLLGPVLGLARQQQGRALLHAAAVVCDDSAIAFTGPHGVGKSTLSAAFVRRGHPLLSDDVLPVLPAENGVYALPSVPRIKLWEDSLGALGENVQDYDRVLRCTEKRRVVVGRDWGELATQPMPLRALYLLSPHADPEQPITFATVNPATGVLRLLANAYMAEILHGTRAVKALEAAARLLNTVHVREVSYCRSFDRLPQLLEALVADASQRTSVCPSGVPYDLR